MRVVGEPLEAQGEHMFDRDLNSHKIPRYPSTCSACCVNATNGTALRGFRMISILRSHDLSVPETHFPVRLNRPEKPLLRSVTVTEPSLSNA